MVNNPKYNLDEICVSKQKPRTLRRINGLQLPLHPQQIIGWIAIVLTTVVNYTTIIPAQCEWFQEIVWSTFLTLHLLHAVSHATALLLDPAEQQLRQLSRSAVPEFDRNIHAHVIENGRCHLCNIQTSSKDTKHCSICNKCIFGFDHHCKWLNHCIGKRNYVPFFMSVSTATILTLLTATICFLDIIFYFVSPQLLNTSHRQFLVNEPNATVFESDPIDWKFISVLSVFGSTNSIIGCVLMHLCAFHIYIRILGVSTYEYIVRNVDPELTDDGSHLKDKRNMCNLSLLQSISNLTCRKKYRFNNNRVGNTVNAVSNNYVGKVEAPEPLQSDETYDIIHRSTINNNGYNVTNLMSIIMDKVNSTNQLFYKQQKQVHPTECVLE